MYHCTWDSEMKYISDYDTGAGRRPALPPLTPNEVFREDIFAGKMVSSKKGPASGRTGSFPRVCSFLICTL